MGQNALTVITRIRPGEVAALSQLLDAIGNDINGNPYLCFPNILSVHFACWVILSDDPNFPPTLVFESNYDGDLDSHLDELIGKGGAGIDAIYGKCEAYPTAGVQSPDLVKQYLKASAVVSPAFYIGVPGQTVGSIRNAIAVREEIETYLDTAPAQALRKSAASGATGEAQVFESIRRHMAEPGAVKPQVSPETLNQQRARAGRNLILLLLFGVPIVLLALPFLIAWMLLIRLHEIRDDQAPALPPLPIDPRLFGKEDIFVQNHLTTLVNVKPGKFRLWTLKGILALINLLAKTFFITGQLGGIPTIHFARWILMDNDRRLLFFSNYDGSWASYLGDFVDKANYGLTSVWSATESFPSSRWLFFGGAQHIEAFKQWSRQHNVYAPVWYSAYPDETLWNLQKDIQIRDDVGRPLNPAETEAFLQRF